MGKVIRISEKQLINLMGNIKGGAPSVEEVITDESSTSQSEDMFNVKLNGGDIDSNIDFNSIMKGLNYNLGTVTVKDSQYELTADITQMTIGYSIELEYRDYGIRDVVVTPRNISITGLFEVQGDEQNYSQDFSIQIDAAGNMTNTFSGNTDLGEGETLFIPEIANNVTVDTKFAGGGGDYFTGIYIKSAEIYVTKEKTQIILFY